MKVPVEKLCALLAVLFTGVGLFSAWRSQERIQQLSAIAVHVVPSGSASEARPSRPAMVANVHWPKPSTQSQGRGWVYEVFTAPMIYYDKAAKIFSADLPTGKEVKPEELAGWALLAVKRDLFGLQLAGYFGGPGDYLVAFTSPRGHDTWLMREGERFEELALTFREFTVKKVSLEHEGAWPVHEEVAFAVLYDERAGKEAMLDSREQKFTDTPVAVLRVGNGAAEPRELREGDTFSCDGVEYRVQHIQLEPAEIVLARFTPGLPVPELKRLRLRSAIPPTASWRPAILNPIPCIASSYFFAFSW